MRAMDKEAALFRVLGHPFRIQLLEALRDGESCVCHLCALFNRPQPYVSKQLAELRDAGVVVDRRDGLRIYYKLVDPSIGTALDAARLALVRVGMLRVEEMASINRLGRPVPGCECPDCIVA